jgi:hypothetical protein
MDRSRPTSTQKIWQRWKSNPGPLGLQDKRLKIDLCISDAKEAAHIATVRPAH